MDTHHSGKTSYVILGPESHSKHLARYSLGMSSQVLYWMCREDGYGPVLRYTGLPF